MKRVYIFALIVMFALCAGPVGAQASKPIYVSLPGPGTIQHLAYVVAKEKKFCESALKALANEPGAKP
jgi:ABC-type nitrate/sulfonate/bicarbonate transport system substrate-binding protein